MNWFREMMSGASGEVSSKRTILFFLIFLFISLTIASQVTGHSFDEILKTQLFWLIQTCLVLVFGERALAAWEAISKRTIDKKESSVTKTEVTTKTADPEKPKE